jgi:protein-disulfide isomerase/uncharacterized membrane protein
MGIVVAMLLCLAGAAVSGVLLGQHYGEGWAVSALDETCGDSQTSGCADVARSPWSSFAGMPVAAFGLAFYFSIFLLLTLALFALPDLQKRLAAIAMAMLVLGLLADLYLLGLQAFAIHAYCALCILTYVLSAGALIALIPACRSGRSAAVPILTPESRLAFAGWILGTLAVIASVFGFDAMLESRAAVRKSTLFGTLVPAPSVARAPAAPAAPDPMFAKPEPVVQAAPAKIQAPPSSAKVAKESKDAEYWQKQAKHLEATLDDPRKVEAYYAEKAQREFDASAAATIDFENIPARGFASAPVTIVEYSDFLCPACREFGVWFSQYMAQLSGRVMVYFKNFPLDKSCNDRLGGSTHPGACNLALGGICAHKQGKFEAYHDRVFATELIDPQPADVMRIGGEAGLDTAALQSCLDDPKAKTDLATQIAEANRLGVHSTPTFYINGKKLPRLADFIRVVDREAQKKGFKPLGQ